MEIGQSSPRLNINCVNLLLFCRGLWTPFLRACGLFRNFGEPGVTTPGLGAKSYPLDLSSVLAFLFHIISTLPFVGQMCSIQFSFCLLEGLEYLQLGLYFQQAFRWEVSSRRGKYATPDELAGAVDQALALSYSHFTTPPFLAESPSTVECTWFTSVLRVSIRS